RLQRRLRQHGRVRRGDAGPEARVETRLVGVEDRRQGDELLRLAGRRGEALAEVVERAELVVDEHLPRERDAGAVLLDLELVLGLGERASLVLGALLDLVEPGPTAADLDQGLRLEVPHRHAARELLPDRRDALVLLEHLALEPGPEEDREVRGGHGLDDVRAALEQVLHVRDGAVVAVDGALEERARLQDLTTVSHLGGPFQTRASTTGMTPAAAVLVASAYPKSTASVDVVVSCVVRVPWAASAM